MPAARVDLDHNATTPLLPCARDAVLAALGLGGNPSSVHAGGRQARDAVETARAQVAALVGGAAAEVVFTSGGTEADVLGVLGPARAAVARGKPARVITSPVEHPAVRGAVAALGDAGFEVVVVPVDAQGRLDVDAVRQALSEGAALATFALANHELGNLYPVAELARYARAAGTWLHCDSVQAAGKVPVDVRELGVDLLSLSAHKLGGPAGVGALWVRRGVTVEPLFPGGAQERGLRPGTENLAGIVGFGAAAAWARGEGLVAAGRVAVLRDRLEQGLVGLGARVHGDVGARVGNTTNVAFEGASGELVVVGLDLEGISVSMGAACSSGSVEPSPVILALGQPRERAGEAVRLSLGTSTTDEDVARALAATAMVVARVRAANAR